MKSSNATARGAFVMQVHDELLVEVPEQEVEKVREILKHEMETAVSLDVPLVADVGVGEIGWTPSRSFRI